MGINKEWVYIMGINKEWVYIMGMNKEWVYIKSPHVRNVPLLLLNSIIIINVIISSPHVIINTII